jgi:hypothetical protein
MGLQKFDWQLRTSGKLENQPTRGKLRGSILVKYKYALKKKFEYIMHIIHT